MLLSVHIPKTAGSTLKAILRQAYGTHVYFDYQDQYTFVDLEPPTVPMRARRWVKRLKYRRGLRSTDQCIHGHFRARKYLAQFPGSPLMTWVRDPVERVASHYHHWRRNPDRAHSVCRRLLRDRLTLVQFAEIEVMRNLQTRYLDGLRLDQFGFVGVQEQFDQLVTAMFDFLGIEPFTVSATNVSPDKGPTERYRLDAATRERLRELNQEDEALYRAAQGRAVTAGRS